MSLKNHPDQCDHPEKLENVIDSDIAIESNEQNLSFMNIKS